MSDENGSEQTRHSLDASSVILHRELFIRYEKVTIKETGHPSLEIGLDGTIFEREPSANHPAIGTDSLAAFQKY